MTSLLDAMRDLFREWLGLPFTERFTVFVLVVGPLVVWIHETHRYWRLRRKASHVLRLAPVTVRGELLDALGPGGVAAALSAELSSIRAALDRVLGTRPCPYLAPAIGADSGYYLVGLRHEGTVPIEMIEPEVEKVQQALSLKVGGVSIPISELIDTAIAIVGLIPVPGRTRYRKSLLRVSIVQSGEQSRLQVSRPPDAGAASAVPALRSEFRAANSATAFTETAPTRTLTELNDVIRNAAFMILEMHGAFGGRRWRSMRRLLDGLEALDEYRRRGGALARDRARKCMSDAAESDPDNLEALYYHGVLTMVDQTDGAIDRAARCFQRTLEATPVGTARPQRLRSMSHAGLAYCNAQRWHRLGRRRREILDKALFHTREAEKEWRALQQAQTDADLKLHPLLPYTRALVTTVDEGSRDQNDDRVRRFTDAYHLYRQAIRLQPDNGMFYNNAGWVLLKLAEWGETMLAPEDGRPHHLDVALLAERFFHKSLGMHPENKLTHANLCLLYSVAPFCTARDGDSLNRARYHGLRAVRIDPAYVNGHRDLAVALVRFGRLDEAYAYYSKALELAELPDKDREIIDDLVEEVGQRPDLGPDELKRWQSPPGRLLEPAPAML